MTMLMSMERQQCLATLRKTIRKHYAHLATPDLQKMPYKQKTGRGAAITVPPLRERHDDLPDLVRHFLVRVCEENNLKHVEIQQEAIACLQSTIIPEISGSFAIWWNAL